MHYVNAMRETIPFEQITATLTRDVPEIPASTMNVKRLNSDIVADCHRFHSRLDRARLVMTFSREARRMEFEESFFYGRYTGRNLMARVVERAARVCFWMDIPDIRIYAVGMGPKFWADIGAQPKSRKERVKLAEKLGTRLEALQPYLPAPRLSELQRLAGLRHVEDLRLLSHAQDSLPPEAADAVQATLDQSMREYWVENPMVTRPGLTVGRVMLAEASFKGRFSLDDPRQRALLAQRVARGPYPA